MDEGDAKGCRVLNLSSLPEYAKEEKQYQIIVKSDGLATYIAKDIAFAMRKLGYISKGSLNKNTFINEMKEYAKVVVTNIKNSQDKFKHDNITRNKCPQCEKFMLEVNGKKGKMFVCQDRECGYKKNISILTMLVARLVIKN